MECNHFNVVCIDDNIPGDPMCPDIIKDKIYTVVRLHEDEDGLFYVLMEMGAGNYYNDFHFVPIPPAYENIAPELAAAAMNVGDTADQPVKIKQPQTN